ncbi:MAG: PorT family protein [Lentimicrobiaceae bacterium]|nr:PorT family protein [Lentimicrobiaceae bacterium]
MKKTTILLIFIALMSNAICQDDTTLKSDSLTAEDKLFHGSYETDDERAVSTDFCFSKFTKSKKVKYKAHSHGIFAGFSNLATRDLSEIGIVKDAELKLSSFEIGLTIFGMNVQLSKKYGWLFFTGLGFRVQQYNADRNYAFVELDDVTVQIRPEEGHYYSKSRLAQWYMHLPIMFEYQKKISKRSSFFVQTGVELGLKLSSKSSVVYRDERNKKIHEKLGKGMNVTPLTVDARVEIGLNSFGLYARYGLIELFRKNRGPEVIPVAAGVIWHL